MSLDHPSLRGRTSTSTYHGEEQKDAEDPREALPASPSPALLRPGCRVPGCLNEHLDKRRVDGQGSEYVKLVVPSPTRGGRWTSTSLDPSARAPLIPAMTPNVLKVTSSNRPLIRTS
jgi:hypothetical protein